MKSTINNLDNKVLVYKIDNPVQISLLSSLVFNFNTWFFYLTYSKALYILQTFIKSVILLLLL